MQREDLIDTDSVKVSSIEMAPGEQSPWHYHTYIRESVFCLRGRLLAASDAEHGMVLTPGDRVDFSPGERHALHNMQAEPSAYLLVQRGRHDFIQCESPGQGNV